VNYALVELVSGRPEVGRRIRWREGEQARSGQVCETRRVGDGPIQAIVKLGPARGHELRAVEFAPTPRGRKR
jgi:hypothetical protein